MQHARHLGHAPILREPDGAHCVRPTLAAVDQAALGDVGAAAGAAELAWARVRLVEAAAVRGEGARPVVAAAGEGEERRRLPGGEAGPGQLARVEIGCVSGVVETVSGIRVEVEVAVQRAIGGIRGEVELEVGPGGPAGPITKEIRVPLIVVALDQEALRGEERIGVGQQVPVLLLSHRAAPVVLGREVAGLEVTGDVAAEPYAGVGARQDPAGDAADVADLDQVFDRGRLEGGQVGRPSARDGENAGCDASRILLMISIVDLALTLTRGFFSRSI